MGEFSGTSVIHPTSSVLVPFQMQDLTIKKTKKLLAKEIRKTQENMPKEKEIIINKMVMQEVASISSVIFHFQGQELPNLIHQNRLGQ